MKNIDIAYSLMNLFKEHGEELYLVGGSVRDYLLFNDFEDFDFATTALPEKTLEILNCAVKDKFPLKFGTVKTKYMDKDIEITTLRKEYDYNDHRRPSRVEFIKDVKEDSLRRDISINALYLGIDDIIDYHNGKEDLNNRVIRIIGNPIDRFNEDAIRILRCIRFSLVLGFSIEENTLKAIQECKHLLNEISEDKKQSEFNKMLKYKSKEEVANIRKEFGI